MIGSQEITVSELNLTIADAIRRDLRLRSLSVRGEISGFKHHIASGHWYFALKDRDASISCVMFRQNTFRSLIRPKDGDAVSVTGYVDVYPKNGAVQFYVTGMKKAGEGDLYLQFEALKRKLDAEGLFDPARKKKLPMVPRKVAIVTSESGAALHDILNVSAMRSPAIPIVLVPVPVQGPEAAREIAEGLRKANRIPGVDVIILSRGGGSAEDLWCFNEEAVARAVAESRVPVVSGVGHEVDILICDLAADVRASTPSNAAEIVFPDREELKGRIRLIRSGLQRAFTEQIRRREQALSALRIRLYALSPERRLAMIRNSSALGRARLLGAVGALLERKRHERQTAGERLTAAARHRIETEAGRLTAAGERLRAVSPLGVLSRGYALVYSDGGRMIKTAAEAARETAMTIRFADGQVAVTGGETDGSRKNCPTPPARGSGAERKGDTEYE